MPTIEELRARAQIIANEKQIGGNTAQRVGGAFNMTADLIEGVGGRVDDATAAAEAAEAAAERAEALAGTAADSAEAAARSAEAAASSAETAAELAGQAATAAQTATQAAGTAQTAAQTAQDMASRAMEEVQQVGDRYVSYRNPQTLTAAQKETARQNIGAVAAEDVPSPELMERVTWQALKEMRDAGELVAGKMYRIVDYQATTTQADTRSAGHQFDIAVLAVDGSTLNEQAWAILHEGDAYFASCNLPAWELHYKLDNVNWSLQAGTYVSTDQYTFHEIGTIVLDGETYILWEGDAMYSDDWTDYAVSRDSEVDSSIYAYYDDNEFSDEEVGIIKSKEVRTVEGKGTVIYMKDEFGNECPYDFKNMQFKRWKVTDSMEGRTGFTDTYLGVLDYTPAGLDVEDADDYIWAYTFSSSAEGGEQADTSLGGHSITDNVMKPYGKQLNNNVLFGDYCYNNSFSQNCYRNSFSQYCYNNSFSQGCQNNSFSQGCYNNSFSQDCYNNSFSQYCYNNSFSQDCGGNSFSQGCNYNSFSHGCYNNSFSQGCQNNSFSQYCYNNSFSQYCYNNSFSQYCYNNSFSQYCNNIHLNTNYICHIKIESLNQYINLSCSQSTNSNRLCKNIVINKGVNNTQTAKSIVISTVNQNYQTTVKSANDVEVTA